MSYVVIYNHLEWLRKDLGPSIPLSITESISELQDFLYDSVTGDINLFLGNITDLELYEFLNCSPEDLEEYWRVIE